MQLDAAGSMDDSTVPEASADVVNSPIPAQRRRSMTANAADRMRAQRSSSRMSHTTPSRHSDEESSKTAVKVGRLPSSISCCYRVSIANPSLPQLFEYARLSNLQTLDTTSYHSDSARARAKSRPTRPWW